MNWRSARTATKGILRNPIARFLAATVGSAAILIAALAPLASVLVEGWALQDVESRARLVFRSVRDQVASGLAATPGVDLTPYFNRLAEDERILALGYCTREGKLEFATKLLPRTIDCKQFARAATDTSKVVSQDGHRIHVAVFPLSAGPGMKGHLLILHDLSYADGRTRKARVYVTLALVGAVLGLGILGVAVIVAVIRRWTASLRSTIEEMRGTTGVEGHARGSFPMGPEVRSLLHELQLERQLTEGIQVDWSPKTLAQLLIEELPGVNVLVVSNRQPYIHNRSADGGIELQLPASGLVSALEPVMRTCRGTWIAHGSGTADRETVDLRDHIRVPPDQPEYTLRRLWLTDEEVEGYYYGIANEGLWPLCHIAFVRPVFREQDFAQYVRVNQKFADAVAAEAQTDDPIVLVQDYHFALAPRMIRKLLPKATIITFWHIPWPNSETFGICPWRAEIIDGLLGSTILGFHTQFHCNNFLEGTDRFIESRIDRELSSVTAGAHETLIRPYPISIAWPPAAMEGQPPIAECRRALREQYGLPDNIRIAVGIERFDYTKGILDRIRAIDDLLTRRPEQLSKLVFIQAAAPTRSKLDAYHSLQMEAVRLADEVNARHGGPGYKPVLLAIRHHDPREVYALFRGADMCIVSSLHDGMNLVAKEFVAARDDEDGVLILSSFAGASRELAEALIVNPYDTHAMADAIGAAIDMPAGERRDRMRLMRDLVRHRNVYRWAAQMLLDAAHLRNRDKIMRETRYRR